DELAIAHFRGRHVSCREARRPRAPRWSEDECFMKGSAKMIPSDAARALSGPFPSTSALARHRVGILTLLVALPAAVARAQVGEAPPKPAFADNAPVIPHESLTKVSLPNTTIDSVELNKADGSCRVRATVTHPPTGCRVKVFVALPTKGWNGRFQGTGG